MNYKIDHIPKSSHKRPGVKMRATSFTIHSTANKTSTAQNERDNLAREGNLRSASFHIAVDDKQAIECIPLNEISYHAGVREGNNTSISIEICESGDRDKTVQNAVELVAKMLYERKWNVDKLKRHFDWSGKICPGILSKNNWEGWTKYKNDVGKELNRLKGASEMSKLEKIKINLHGKALEVEGIIEKNNKGSTNYIPIRFLEQLGYSVGWKDNKVTIDYKGEDK